MMNRTPKGVMRLKPKAGEVRMELEKKISEFMKRQMEEQELSKKKEKIQVCINPNSYIGKEIQYQTALLHEILAELRKGKSSGKAALVEDAHRIHFLCNGEQEGCERRTCYKTNENSEPVCRHTPDVRYALNFSRLPYKKSAYWEGIVQKEKEAADTKKQ